MQSKLLPLVAAMAAASGAQAGSLALTNAPVPTNDLDKRSILTSQFAIVDGKKLDVAYNTIMRSGATPNRRSLPFGTLIDIHGDPIIDADGNVRVSNDNDFSSLIQAKGKDLYMVSHFESRPAAMYLTQLWQHPKSGELKPLRTRPLDFSHVNGGWVHCAGSVTPWGNHLGSEEYPPDAKQWRDKTIDDYNAFMAQYFGVEPAIDENGAVLNQDELIAVMNPYDYGYTIEVDVKNFNKADVVKHYSMGRVAIELSYVMPNRKTVYTSDDGSRVGLFRYEADRKGDLSAGTLYAAKWTQTSPIYGVDERVADDLRDGGAGMLSWVELGHASDKEIRDIIDSGVTFEQIFAEDVPGCTTIINRDTGADGECLKVKDGMDKAAAFLETSRYAGIRGATIEFEKMEGITLDPDTNTMYLAMSRVINAMTDGAGDINVPYNYCGTVYGLDLDENYVATNMYGVVAGLPRTASRGALVDNPYPEDGPYASNNCDLNAISEPDNLTFIPGYKTLVIGEDTGQHQNDVVWAYNVDSQELTRVQTTPYGSETTSPYFYPDINGFSYIMSVIQHPFGESDQDALQVDEEARGYTGYLGPFPALMDGDYGRDGRRD
jgi:secreted PhoX family phosphatase